MTILSREALLRRSECMAAIQLLSDATSEDGCLSPNKLRDLQSAFRESMAAYKLAFDKLNVTLVESEQDQHKRKLLLDTELLDMQRLQSEWDRLCELNARKSLLEASRIRRSQRKGGGGGSKALLMDVRSRLESEMVRMEKVETGLENISQNILQSGQLFANYANQLKIAKMYLNQIMRRAEEDGRYLYYAWIFLCCSCLFVIIRRFGILKIAYYSTRLVMWLCHLLVSVWRLLFGERDEVALVDIQ